MAVFRRKSSVPSSPSAEVLDAFWRWLEQRTQRAVTRRPAPLPEPSKCEARPPELCQLVKTAEGPEQVVPYRQPVQLATANIIVDPQTEENLRFACAEIVPKVIDDVDTGETIFYPYELALDLRYQHHWYYRRSLIGALSASLALAPGETLSLSVRNTQRKQFEQQTVDEVERSQQTESTVADKDVLNVTRSASKTNNWNISGNASITLPKGGAIGISGQASRTVNQTSSSSAQRTRESTRKAASNLKTLQKIQVRELTEVTTEAATARKITNPYRDRSLRLDVYELAKDYCVEFHLTEIVPVMILDLDELLFDRHFVLTNGAFLSDELIDRLLELELSQALQLTTDLRIEGAEERAQQTALLAFKYLFDGPVIFNFPIGEEFPISNDWGGGRPPSTDGGTWDENDPASSFLDPIYDYSGLVDATHRGNKVGVIFSTLAFFYQLYRREVLPVSGVRPSPDGRLAVELAMSLDQVLAPRWVGVDETDAIENVIDARHATEVLRRLGGFLTMTSGILRPLLEPAEEEREARRAAERAEWVVGRVVDHLRCHARYYTERYLHYMADRTRMRAVFRFVEDALARISSDVGTQFDPEAAFLDRNRIVVPLRIPLSREELKDLLKKLDRERGEEITFGILDSQQLTVPTDGVHIEPAAGSCVLADIPEGPVTEPIRIVVQKD
ncbi:hypothetical protein AB0L35_03590 [Streptomyces sp. NPDC052309]|uniref:hypothetical protein n=1 Tax=Streptomyces sp. NPDC052309 TaxID=3155421 RepID=UPI003437DD4F